MFHQKIHNLQKKFKANWLVILVILAFLVGGIVGGMLLSSRSANAGIFSDLYNNFFQGLELNNSLNQNVQSSPQTFSTDYEKSIVSAVEKASPAVVSIVISKDVPIIEQCPYNPFSDLPEEFQQFFNFGGGAQFYQPCQKGTQKKDVGGGSGFIVTADGLIVTNRHVVNDKSADYTVFTNDGNKYSAKVLALHPTLDIALIKINGNNFPTLKLGDSRTLKLGQTTIAIGNALGEFRNTVSVGVVSGLSRSVTASSGNGVSELIQNVIQTDAAINPGNSGGPLLNSSGEVIGINVAMVSGAQNIGFSIPINTAKKSIESVSSSGQLRVAFLGVRYKTLDADLAEKYETAIDYGALLKGDGNNPAVEKDSPADKAGLKEGDIILEIDGQKIDSNNTLAYVVSQKNSGDKVTLKILRDKNEMTVEIVLGERK